MDEIAWQIHDKLGSEWAMKIAESDAVAKVMARGELSHHDWKAKVREALLDAGADVDCVKYAREHGLLASAVRQ